MYYKLTSNISTTLATHKLLGSVQKKEDKMYLSVIHMRSGKLAKLSLLTVNLMNL